MKYNINEKQLRRIIRQVLENEVVKQSICEAIQEREMLNEWNWKGAALGTMMGVATLGGMQSCSPVNPPQQTTYSQHIEWQDYSDRPWAFQSYIGKTIEATYLVVEDKYMIKDLVLNIPTNAEEYEKAGFTYSAIFQDCSWAIAYEKTEKRDKYLVDIYHTHGSPLADKPNPETGEYLNGEAYFELWYTDDESLPMNERAQFIRVYKSPNEKSSTTWQVNLNYVKQNNRINIYNQ